MEGGAVVFPSSGESEDVVKEGSVSLVNAMKQSHMESSRERAGMKEADQSIVKEQVHAGLAEKMRLFPRLKRP